MSGCSRTVGAYVRTVEAANEVREKLGLPLRVRASFALGGYPGSHPGAEAHSGEMFGRIVEEEFARSPIHEVLIEVIGR